MAGMNEQTVVDPLVLMVSLAQSESMLAMAAFVGSLALAWTMAWGVRRLSGGSDMASLVGRTLY
ncbi:MAG: mechanosensitive ion channel protein, partial [Burkholderiales bacterium]